MSTYLIDFENTKSAGMQGVNDLSAKDKIYVFYSRNADTISVELHQQLLACKAEINFSLVTVGGKNSLDFQLVTFLGYLLGKEPNEKYIIVSGDEGFSYAVNFWKERKANVVLSGSIKKSGSSGSVQNPQKKNEPNKADQQIISLFSDKDVIQTVTSYISKYKTKQTVYQALVKKYSQKKGLEIYKKIKPLIKNKK